MEFSIKWKLFASFAISMLAPLLAHLVGVSIWLCIILGLVIILLFTSYAYYRILHSLTTIQRNLKPLYDRHGLNLRPEAHPDELMAAVQWSDRLMESMTASIEKFNVSHEQYPLFTHGQHQIFKALLSSGDSIAGELICHDIQLDVGLTIPHFDAVRNEEIFNLSLSTLKDRLGKMRQLIEQEKDRGIIDFQIYFLEDRNFIEGFLAHNSRGLSLELSLDYLFQEFIHRLEQVDNDMIRSRIHDLTDLKIQLFQEITACVHRETSFDHHLKDRIVLVTNLYPSQVLTYHKSGVKGILCREGTASSHAQILLESLGVPSLSELESFAEPPEGESVLLDTESRRLIFNPKGEDLKRLESSHSQFREDKVIHHSIQLSSGEDVWIKTNLNIARDVHRSLTYGPDGIGLFRSEVAFLGMGDLPEEEELYRQYQRITRAYHERPVTFRMLDIGGDKLVGVHSVKEENPCMGLRSMRLLKAQPALFRAQFRAMRRAAHSKTYIIFPMVNGRDELDDVMQQISIYDKELVEEGFDLPPVKYGIMVEVPSIVECFESIVEHFDLFSIGTNDLTQYTMAADRNNQGISSYYSPLHPAILSMVSKVCRLGNEYQKEVCLCGEVAADSLSLPLWLGLGIRQFSLPYRYIPRLKQSIQNYNIHQCEELSSRALKCQTILEVKQLLDHKKYHPDPSIRTS